MVYGDSSVIGIESGSDGDGDGRVDVSNCCLESTDLVLDSLSDLYSKLNVFPCKG